MLGSNVFTRHKIMKVCFSLDFNPHFSPRNGFNIVIHNYTNFEKLLVKIDLIDATEWLTYCVLSMDLIDIRTSLDSIHG